MNRTWTALALGAVVTAVLAYYPAKAAQGPVAATCVVTRDPEPHLERWVLSGPTCPVPGELDVETFVGVDPDGNTVLPWVDPPRQWQFALGNVRAGESRGMFYPRGVR